MNKLFPFLALLLTLPCTLFFCAAGRADFGFGTRVPLPTAAGQIPVSVASGLSFTYQPVTFSPDGVHWTFGGGTLSTNSVLTANVANAGDSGLTVNMPSGGTGHGVRIFSSTGDLGCYLDGNNGAYFKSDVTIQYDLHVQKIYPNGNTFNFIGGPNLDQMSIGSVPASSTMIGIGFPDGTVYNQSPDTYLWRPAKQSLQTGALFTALAFASAVRTVTATTDTATTIDSTIEFNASAACTETLPAASTWKGQRITLIDLSANSVAVSNTVLGSPADTLSGIGASETFFSDNTNIVLVH